MFPYLRKNQIGFKFYVFLSVVLIVLISLVIWFFKEKPYYTNIPIRFTSGSIPLVEIEIQGKEYTVEIDLGSEFQLTLAKKVIDQLYKQSCGTLVSRDMKGRAYKKLAYRIPLVKMNNISFSDVLIDEQSEEFIENNLFWTDPSSNRKVGNKVGVLGRELIETKNLLLDFKNHKFLITNDVKKLKDDGYNLAEFAKLPFEMTRTGAVLVVDTDMGKVRLSVDTGCTVSLLRASHLPKETPTQDEKYNLPLVTTSQFEIGEKNFGPMDLYLIDIAPQLHEIDGLLGMDFLKKHIVYLDHAKKIAYIQ